MVQIFVKNPFVEVEDHALIGSKWSKLEVQSKTFDNAEKQKQKNEFECQIFACKSSNCCHFWAVLGPGMGHLFTKESLSLLTSTCHVYLHSHKMLWLYWMDSLESPPLNPPNG